MNADLDVQVERIDDIPLLVFVVKRLEIDQIVNQYAGTHIRQRGLDIRVMTFMEMLVRHELRELKTAISGLYRGQPSRLTTQPMAHRILDTLSRANINLSRICIEGSLYWDVTKLPDNITFILKSLGIPLKLYSSKYYQK